MYDARQEEMTVLETVPVDDVFVCNICKIENLGHVTRVWLCAPENGPVSCCVPVNVVKARLIIPTASLVVLARALVPVPLQEAVVHRPAYVS